MDPALKPEQLLELSDAVRESIKYEGRFASSKELMQDLSLFLQTTLSEEERGVPSIEYDTIKTAHLDYLLKDIVSHTAETGPQSARALEYAKTASDLLRRWQVRFGTDWFELDKRRTLDMIRHGRLREVSFVTPTTELTPTQHTWKFTDMDPASEVEGNSQFRVGQWWLNIACAHRDGIVGSELEKPTKLGRYEDSALPLLTGKEEIVKDGEIVHYTRVGGMKDMQFSLMSLTGKPIRILRGFQLMSGYAPLAGVRYDGLWNLTSYRHHQDEEKGLAHLRITLQRLAGQPPMKELKKIPRPSQVDDFRSYQQYEIEIVKRTEGIRAAHEWGVQNEEEKRERESWARIREFRSSIGAGPMRPLSGTTGLGITLDPESFGKSIPRKSEMQLRLPPAIQAKANKAEQEARLKREGIVKKTVIDTSLNQEYQSKSRDSGQFEDEATRGRQL
ncbi:PUA-like domain-containing protein [Podospora aff. communis PSN243]|uniref:PUA-like domain-containing protein n=1 Tax=Podospora aff. communis PSN243 TaxID=3040156 RepID=A0AAV9H5U1_9PEZI|nr:PUA-like domain-containing protein [Podospora aff. communis PSN243]